MEFEELKERIKKHEGYRSSVFLDTLGKRTIGYGHLCTDSESWQDGVDYNQKQLEKVFEYDFNIAVGGADNLLHDCGDVPTKAKEVIIEMVFQMGKTGVSKFKKMFAAIKEKKFNIASLEMLDSRWSEQTPHRAKELSEIMKNV